MKKIAVVGAGNMARVRTKAFLDTGKVEIRGVASRHLDSARKFGAEIGVTRCFDDFRKLAEVSPDAVLVEVPHVAQDEIVLWALDQGISVLIGSPLATSTTTAEKINQKARSKGLAVEAGYEARYCRAWEAARRLVRDGALGKIAIVRSIALWEGDPQSWYYSQETSGGMPLTHMTYCFVNPLRWILGDPLYVSAFTNRVKVTGPGTIQEETCAASLLFENDVLCSLMAGFVKPGKVPGWSATFIGTEKAVEIFPRERAITVYEGEKAERKIFGSPKDAFRAQAEAFINSLDGAGECRNTPADAIGDVRVAEAIVSSARGKKTIAL